MAGAGRARLLQLSRRADQCACAGRVPAPCHRPLAAHAAASQPKGSAHVGADDATGGRVASQTDHPPSLAKRTLRRHTPEVGAVCGQAARTVLCGGRVMKHASLVRCGLLSKYTDLLSSEESGEPLASLWRMSLCGRLGPVFPSSAVQTGRYPGTRMSVDPVYKVARSGARVEEMRWRDRTVIDGILGIDVCKNTLDVSISSYTKVRTKSFTNSPDGWRHLLDWLIAQKIQRVHACLESTGRYSLGIACALYEADHVVSIINPAQIRDFVRTKLGRNKTDGVDASHIREYFELFKPSPWVPPSEAHRRLGELQTIRSGIVAGLTEWKNRKNSGIVAGEAQALADATISHFTSQLGAVDKAIALTIDNDRDLQSKRDLLLTISGVGETLAGVVLAELPGPDVLRSSAEVVAYAGLNPRQHQSGTSIDRATRISKIGNAVLRAALYMPALSAMRYNSAIVALVARLKSRGRLKPKQIVVAAMRKLLVLCFGVLKTGRPFDAAIAMGG